MSAMGGSKSSSSGGTSSGKVQFPEHLFYNSVTYNGGFVWKFLSRGTHYTGPGTGLYSMNADIGQASAKNPYKQPVAYDPTASLARIAGQFQLLDTYISDLDTSLDWRLLAKEAEKALENTSIGEDAISTAASDEEAQQGEVYAHSRNRAYAGIQDILSSMTAAFSRAGSILSGGHTQILESMQARLRLAASNQKIGAINQAVSELMRFFVRTAQVQRASFLLLNQVEKLGLVYDKESKDRNLLLQDESARWNLSLWQYPANIVTAITGGGAGIKDEDFGLGAGSVLRGELGQAGIGGKISEGV